MDLVGFVHLYIWHDLSAVVKSPVMQCVKVQPQRMHSPIHLSVDFPDNEFINLNLHFGCLALLLHKLYVICSPLSISSPEDPSTCF